MTPHPLRILLAGLSLAAGARAETPVAPRLGVFSGELDVGVVSRPGTASFDGARQTYTVGSSGANMWFGADAMHFVWKRVSGDGSIAAAVAFLGTSAQPHRKACLVIRQSLEAGSPYVDVAEHGDGLTSLQFREVAGGPTREIQSNVSGPGRVRLDKIGDVVYLSVSKDGAAPHPSGCSFRLHFSDPFYIGLAVCSHDNTAFETAEFSKVEIGTADKAAAAPQPLLKIITLPSGDRRVSDL